ncbi:uncharacterized protein LOC115882039 isoform X2 [Sitophilus oryzae]|uniref:Uncharacterized protein LOC115882039 isoform X2 n=1 Tax=Sitophilus oryzae TaxID=7048 RepID=A0A6J2XY87_SITOR|nr:uncharacterized protein LOC115882039 isoform X2 [Sitophilus oryzae]
MSNDSITLLDSRINLTKTSYSPSRRNSKTSIQNQHKSSDTSFTECLPLKSQAKCLLSSGECVSHCKLEENDGKISCSRRRRFSLEEVILKSDQQELRRKSAQIYRENVIEVQKKSSLRKSSRQRSFKSAQKRESDVEKGLSSTALISQHPQHPRTYSNSSSKHSKKSSRRTSSSDQHSKQETQRYSKRKKIIKAIVGVYLFLLCVSILCVVVTLTHTTTETVQQNNSTVNRTYYTFSAPVYEETRPQKVQKLG